MPAAAVTALRELAVSFHSAYAESMIRAKWLAPAAIVTAPQKLAKGFPLRIAAVFPNASSRLLAANVIALQNKRVFGRMKLLFIPVFLVFFLAAGCLQNGAPSASATPQASDLENYSAFVSTRAELNALLQLPSLSTSDQALLEANQKFLDSQEGAEKLNNLEFDCEANVALYQENLLQLQASVADGEKAVETMPEGERKQSWLAFLTVLQSEKNLAQAALDELCPPQENS